MGRINGAAAVSAARVETQIQMAILSKVLQHVKGQQQNVVKLIEGTLEMARHLRSVEPGQGALVDVLA
ncbi:MAG: hypothetical protein ACE5I3_10260 [Phycisphaerae bacterium]